MFWRLVILAFFFGPLCASSMAAYAQLSGNFSGGGAVRLGYTSEACDNNNRGMIRYSSASKVLEICNGTGWVAGAFNNTSLMRSPNDIGYFVFTESRWNGDLGGTAGADEKCLTELTTKTTWRGYADAQARGILTASKVRAFLCIADNNCAMVLPYATYAFATVGSPHTGGATFTSNAEGGGPNDSANWAAYNYFGTSGFYWAGRVSNSGYNNTTWPTSGGNVSYRCSGYTTSDADIYGGMGAIHTTGANRYYSSSSSVMKCSTRNHLVCIVDP